MISIDTVLIKVASRCNINCSYCYVYNMGDSGWVKMPKIISDDTVNATASRLSELVHSQDRGFAVVLHGGEPLLVGATRLEGILRRLSDALGPNCTLNIQTNGILITERILDICSKYEASLSISIDGPAEIHDRGRLGHRGQPTHALVLRGLDCLKEHPASANLFSGLLAVIDPVATPEDVYHYLKSLDPPSIDFLHRDGNHSRFPAGKASATSTEYGQWLCRLVDLYLADKCPPKIRIIDDMIKLVLGGAGQKEGIGVTDFGILIIDTDGSITKNDTLKSTFNGADRFNTSWSVHLHSLRSVVGSPEYSDFHNLQRPSSAICQSCSDLEVCGGGMPLHRWSDDGGYDNPSVYCADQRLLISHIRKKVLDYIAAA